MQSRNLPNTPRIPINDLYAKQANHNTNQNEQNINKLCMKYEQWNIILFCLLNLLFLGLEMFRALRYHL